MKTYFYFPAGRQMWFDLANELAKARIAEPSLWLGDPALEKQAQERFPSAEIVNFKKFIVTRGAPDAQYTGAHPDFWFSDNFFRIKERAFKLMDRADPNENFRNVDRDVFFNELVVWGLERLTTRKPDFLLYSESPHTASAYVLYELAKFVGTPVYVFASWSLMPIVSLRKNIDGPFSDSPEIARDPEFLHEFDNVVAKYIEGFANPENYSFEPRYMKIQQLRDPEMGRSQQLKRVLTKAVYMLKLLSRSKRIALRRRRALARALAKTTSKLVPENYVYFPLHYEPERTTNPDGGVYHDQIRAIAHLRAVIPPSINIVVKEHPSVFNPRMSGHLGRSPAFYEMIGKIKGVHIVGLANSTPNLILGSRFVASITGTVALEAALLGRPSLTFGNAWFEGCPGIQRFSRELNFDEFLKSRPVQRETIQNWMRAEYLKRGMPGCVNPSNERYYKKYYRDTKLQSLELNAVTQAIIDEL